MKPEINYRQQNIIRELLAAPGKVTLAEIADKTGLNPRIIRYNMKVIEAWLRTCPVQFINKPGYGLEIVASQEVKNNILDELNTLEDCDLILSRQQRVRILLLYLLSEQEPVAAKTISEIENFSRSTIFKDIRGVEEWLKKYDLILRKKSSKGIWIEGREESRRFALVRLIREELGDYHWHRLFNQDQDESWQEEITASHRFLSFLNNLDLDLANQLIRVIEENLNRCVSQKSRVEIMVYMGIMMQAIQSGRSLSGNIENDIKTTDEYAIARIIGYMIEKRIGILPSEKEIELLSALIIGSRWEQNADQDLEEENSAATSQLNEEIAQQIINICSMRLHPMLKIDNILSKELLNHLDYSIFRLKYHIPIRNANLQVVKEKYPEIYRVAESSIFILENKLSVKIPPEEIGYIAMYLLSALERLRTEEDSHFNAIIANDGVRATSSLLQSRLEYEFPNLRVTRIINSFDQTATDDLQGDVIISTLPIENAHQPVIHVQPFLEAENIRDIQDWILKKNQSKRLQNLRSLQEHNSLVDLLKLPHITFAKRVYSWQDMVAMASQSLIASGDIQERYLHAMVDVIENHGFYMYMGSGVLLLHAKPTDGVNKLCMSMLKLEKPFVFDPNTLPETDIIFVLGAADDNTHLTALFQLNELIQHDTFMESIRSAKKPTDIINILWQWLPQLSKENQFI